jgi:hypothetical protein
MLHFPAAVALPNPCFMQLLAGLARKKLRFTMIMVDSGFKPGQVLSVGGQKSLAGQVLNGPTSYGYPHARHSLGYIPPRGLDWRSNRRNSSDVTGTKW